MALPSLLALTSRPQVSSRQSHFTTATHHYKLESLHGARCTVHGEFGQPGLVTCGQNNGSCVSATSRRQ